jgi:hypothetical protein
LGHEAGGGADVVFRTDERLVAPWLAQVAGKVTDFAGNIFSVGNEPPVN